MNISVKVTDHASAKLQAMARGLQGDVLKTAMLAGAKLIEAEAKMQAPIKTGTLRRSIQTELKQASSSVVVVEVGTNLVYAAIQEFGGTIRARNAPYLVFQTDDGAWHSVKEVTIPAHPYIRPAADIAGPKAAETAGRIVVRLLEAA